MHLTTQNRQYGTIYLWPLDLFRDWPHSNLVLSFHLIINLSILCHLANVRASDSSLCLATERVINVFID